MNDINNFENTEEMQKLFSKIDELSLKGRVIIAIEGGSASGKTTLAEILKKRYSCNVFHTDDFFLRPEQRTPQRLSEVGGNVDRERFEKEILSSLKANEAVCYRAYDCSTQSLREPITVLPSRITVVEGVYSMHPSFGEYYGLSLFLDIDAEHQRDRILARNSKNLAKRFFEEWIPLENKYFLATDIKKRVDRVIDVKNLIYRNGDNL